MSSIDALRVSIGAANREILSQIWKYRLSTGQWIPIRLLHQQLGGKPVVRPQLELLGGSIIFETDEASTNKKYGLTFLGILLTSEGDHLETLMAKYLKYAHAKAIAEPLRIEVSSKEVETDLQFTPTETAELGVMLHLSSFFSSGGFGLTEWNVRLPDDIEDLPQDILTYIRDIALRDYDPQVPLASSDRSSYFWGRRKLEAIKEATPTYSFKNIRTLLTEGFTDKELRHLCYDNPVFRSVYNQLAQDTGKADIVDRLIGYADRHFLVEKLLNLVKEHNPTRYEKHKPYHNVTAPGDVHEKPQIDGNANEEALKRACKLVSFEFTRNQVSLQDFWKEAQEVPKHGINRKNLNPEIEPARAIALTLLPIWQDEEWKTYKPLLADLLKQNEFEQIYDFYGSFEKLKTVHDRLVALENEYQERLAARRQDLKRQWEQTEDHLKQYIPQFGRDDWRNAAALIRQKAPGLYEDFKRNIERLISMPNLLSDYL